MTDMAQSLEEQLREYDKKITEPPRVIGYCAFFSDRVCDKGVCNKRGDVMFRCQAWDSSRDCCLRLNLVSPKPEKIREPPLGLGISDVFL